MIVTVNGERFDLGRYASFHERRIDQTLALVRELGGGRVLELGGHPWAMTSKLLREPGIDLRATVSAEETTAWPDEIPLEKRGYEMEFPDGSRSSFLNYSANIERTMFDIDQPVDLVVACEIIEHLTRAPHAMILNANSWLDVGGKLLVTTPNGAQFENPTHLKAKMPAYRYSSYSRHNYVFTLPLLVDLLECCGFEVERAEYWSPYARTGGARLYRALAAAPNPYLRAKFSQTLVVVGRKVESRATASRLPKAYSPDPDWERVDQKLGDAPGEAPIDLH